MFAQYITAATTKREPAPLSESIISFLDRKSIIQPEVEVELNELPDWKLVASDEDFLNPCDFDPEQNAPVQYATYYISEADLKRLRQTLHAESGLHSSTTESICAFLWMHVVKARNVDSEKYPETKLSITVNTRTRMSDPECSPAYWGNLSEPNAVARMPTSQFCGLPEEDSTTATEVPFLTTDGLQNIYNATGTIHSQSIPLSDASNNDYASISSAAAHVKQALAAVDNAAVRRLVGLINQLPTSTSLTWNVDRWPGPDMLIVCLNGTKFNHIDFGPALGCSEAFRATVGLPEGKPDGRCFILPPRASDGGGLEVMLQYDAETLRRLGDCIEFSEFFEWRN